MKILIFLLLIIISGCNKKSATTSEKNSESVNTSEKPNPEKAGTNDSDDKSMKKNTGIGYVRYDISKLSDEIKYSGSVVAMAKWKDRLGENVVFITETREDSNEDDRSKDLFGYHYLINNSGSEQLWKINDFVKDCPVDLTLDYINRSLEITDLDSNGIGESSFLYRMACKGDVSPDDMKLIMHEDKEKFAIRGIMEMKLNGKLYHKGEMNIDPSFNNAPLEFSKYSVEKWNEFKTDNIGD